MPLLNGDNSAIGQLIKLGMKFPQIRVRQKQVGSSGSQLLPVRDDRINHRFGCRQNNLHFLLEQPARHGPATRSGSPEQGVQVCFPLHGRRFK